MTIYCTQDEIWRETIHNFLDNGFSGCPDLAEATGPHDTRTNPDPTVDGMVRMDQLRTLIGLRYPEYQGAVAGRTSQGISRVMRGRGWNWAQRRRPDTGARMSVFLEPKTKKVEQ